jgi:hypothetical protein
MYAGGCKWSLRSNNQQDEMPNVQLTVVFLGVELWETPRSSGGRDARFCIVASSNSARLWGWG